MCSSALQEAVDVSTVASAKLSTEWDGRITSVLMNAASVGKTNHYMRRLSEVSGALLLARQGRQGGAQAVDGGRDLCPRIEGVPLRVPCSDALFGPIAKVYNPGLIGCAYP